MLNLESKFEIIESVGKIVVFLILLLSVYLFTVRTKNRLSNNIFGAYLLVIAFDLIGFFTKQTENYPIVQSLKMSSSLAQLPLFYLYVLSACFSNFKIKIKHIIHFFLFITFFVIFIISEFSKQSLFVYEVIVEMQYIIYIITIFLVLKKYKTLYLENYSNANYEIYKWLFQITILSTIGHMFSVARWILAKSNLQDYILNINIFISFIALSIIIFFVLKALHHPELFKGINMYLKPVNTYVKNEQVMREINKNSQQQLEKIRKLMIQEKPYLDSELTLQKLAVQVDIPEKELSLLINHYLSKHFFDFINEYRINDAKTILEDPSQSDLTILEILYAVGFNSKSSFYSAFKKQTDLTPLEYRKSIS